MPINGVLNTSRIQIQKFEEAVSDIDELVDEDAFDDDMFRLDPDPAYIPSWDMKNILK